MAYNESVYGGANARRGPSPIIWRANTMPWDEINENPNKGGTFWDDFKNAGQDIAAAAITGAFGDMHYRLRTGGTTFGTLIATASQAPGPSTIAKDFGAATMNAAAVAHQSTCIEPGGFTGTPRGFIGIANTNNILPKVAFEAKVKLSAVDATQAFFVGLAEANLTSAINTLFNGSDVLQQKSFVGFYTNATASVNAAYGKNGVAAVNVGSAGTMVASTYTKLGWRYDPDDQVNGTLAFYQDGTLLGKTNIDVTASAFPGAVLLTPVLYIQAAGAGGADVSVTIDWWRAACLYDAGH